LFGRNPCLSRLAKRFGIPPIGIQRFEREQVSAAASAINLARTAYLPQAEFLGQVNRATHNNVFGLLLPEAVIPTISGPALGTNSLGSVWGSAAGTLVSWEAVDFGLRRAAVESAKAVRDRISADVDVTRLQVTTAAADAFLTLAPRNRQWWPRAPALSAPVC